MKKMNKIIALIVTITVLYSSGFSVAQAAVFDWFSDSSDSTSGGASGSLAFNLISSYLNRGDAETDENSDQDVIQDEPEIFNVTEEMILAATAYSSTPDQTDDTPFITAKGTTVRDGIIAANFLPFGTRIKIPDIYGDKIFVVEDRMNRRYWH